MSLDITLLIPGEDSKEFNSFETRHLANNFATTCQQGYIGTYDQWFNHISPDWRKIANQDNPDYQQPTIEVYSTNITHNLGEMADKAGIYEALWRPYKLKPDYNVPEDDYTAEYRYEETNIVIAEEIIPLLEKGLADLKARPTYFEKFNSSNGWGMYVNFVPFVEEYLNACKKYPQAIVKTDR